MHLTLRGAAREVVQLTALRPGTAGSEEGGQEWTVSTPYKICMTFDAYNLCLDRTSCACLGPVTTALCAPIWLEMFEPDGGAESIPRHSQTRAVHGVGRGT